MSSPNDPEPGRFFENDDFLKNLDRAIDSRAAPEPAEPLPAPTSEPVTEPPVTPAYDAAPTTAADEGAGGGKGILGMIGSGVLILLAVIAVKGLKKAAVQVAQDDGRPPRQVQPVQPQFDAETQAHLNKLFGPKQPVPPQPVVEEPGVPLPQWEPTPVGKSPFDHLKPETIPARLRTANLPKELVGIVEPDPDRTWTTEFGLNAVSGRGKVLDQRRLPGTTKVRFLVGGDGDSTTCYELADGKVTEVAEPDDEAEFARLSLSGEHALICDGQEVRRVDLKGDGESNPVAGLGTPTSPYVQMELFDRDRVLILRQKDGQLRKARLVRYGLAEVRPPDEDDTADDIAVSPDRRMFVAVSKAKKTLAFTWTEGGKTLERTLSLPITPVRAALHPGRQFVAVLDSTNMVRIFDLRTAKSFGAFQSRRPPQLIEFADDGRHLLHYNVSGDIYVFRHTRMAEPQEDKAPEKAAGR